MEGNADPAAVPSEDAQEVHVFQDLPGCRVERRNGMVLKSGPGVFAGERDALEYAATLQLPVPRLCSAPNGEKGQPNDIWMEYIEGDSLEDVWPTMSPDQKEDIANQLRQILCSMRRLPSETGIIGSCNGGVAHDGRQMSAYTGGPFTDEASFNDFILDMFKATPVDIRNAIADGLGTGHRILFTHGDLTQHNIIVKDNRIQALLDWEYAGWYPEYWEYVKFFDRHAKHKDWKDYAKHIFPEQYQHELVVCQALRRWQMP